MQSRKNQEQFFAIFSFAINRQDQEIWISNSFYLSLHGEIKAAKVKSYSSWATWVKHVRIILSNHFMRLLTRVLTFYFLILQNVSACRIIYNSKHLEHNLGLGIFLRRSLRCSRRFAQCVSFLLTRMSIWGGCVGFPFCFIYVYWSQSYRVSEEMEFQDTRAVLNTKC